LEKNGFDRILKIIRKGPANADKIISKDGRSSKTVYHDLNLMTNLLIKKEKTGHRNETEYSVIVPKTHQDKIKLRDAKQELDTMRWWQDNITLNEKRFSQIAEEIKLYGRISQEFNDMEDDMIGAQIVRLYAQNNQTHILMSQKKKFPLIFKDLRKQITARTELIEKYYYLIETFDRVHQAKILQFVVNTYYLADKRASDNLGAAEQVHDRWCRQNDPNRITS